MTTTTGAPPDGLGRILLVPPGIPWVMIFMPEKDIRRYLNDKATLYQFVYAEYKDTIVIFA